MSERAFDVFMSHPLIEGHRGCKALHEGVSALGKPSTPKGAFCGAVRHGDLQRGGA